MKLSFLDKTKSSNTMTLQEKGKVVNDNNDIAKHSFSKLFRNLVNSLEIQNLKILINLMIKCKRPLKHKSQKWLFYKQIFLFY